ncbi:archaemetzincin-2-like [Stylophora pistillata]|nr:archaemetzincin-2-like [Stylophora pistillata]
MNGSKSKPINRSAVIGKMKYFDDGVRSLFKLATDSCQNLYQTYTGGALDLREIQTYPEWKVQTCFRNLRKHHRKRSRQRIIYILPVRPFPKVLRTPVEHGSVSIFELIRRFVSCFFFGMTVVYLDEIPVTKVNCKQRFHPDTGKLQLLVTDVMQYLKTNLPADGYCIIGLTWVDLYPGEDWNFVLGESSCEDGCAVVSFGHFEPQFHHNRHLNDTTGQNIAGGHCDKADRTVPQVLLEENE